MTSIRSTMRAAALLGALLAPALPAPAQPAAEPNEIVLGISEGTSGGTDHARVIAKYGDLAQAIGSAAKQQVRVVFIREFAQLEEGMRTGRLNYVMARPSDFPARGIQDYGYHYVATAKPDGQCMLYTRKDSPIKTLAQAKGQRWVLPEQVSYMSRLCTAELRDRGIAVAGEKVQFVREQAAVKFYLDNGFGDVGAVASYSGARKEFEKDGATLIHKSIAQPYFPLIANGKVTPAQVAAIQKALVALKDTEAGQATLQRVGVKEFDVSTETRLRELLAWLAKK
ncbi:MAG: PhnD/SsuA/transferrin family substrate-binding protein [Pseudomonadota bacterium]|jgi:phosphonate transport system substrate-binding protein